MSRRPRKGDLMKSPRRKFLRLAAGAAALPAVSRLAWAQAYPSRPVRIIVGFPAGGQIDIIARLIGQWLSERLGQQFYVDNRPGAASNIATEALVRAAADGHTLFLANATNAVNASLFDKLSFDFIRDTVPVASINRIPLVLEAHPAFPARTVAELIAHAKANPDKVSLASPPKGTAPFMAAELFKMMGGVEMLRVPYRGSAQMVPDLIGGQVQVAFDGISSSIEHIRTGKLQGAGGGDGGAPGGVAGGPDRRRVAARLRGERLVRRGRAPQHAERDHRQAPSGDQCRPRRLQDQVAAADLGVTLLAGSAAQFGKLIADETEKWGKVVRFAGLKPD